MRLFAYAAKRKTRYFLWASMYALKRL